MSVHRVVLDWSMLNQVNQNVLHFDNPDGALSDIEIRDLMLNQWMPICRNRQNANGRWTKITIKRVDVPGQDAFTHFITGGQQGSMDGPPEHPSLCALFSTRTGVATRHGHGRIYMPGLHGGWIENGLIRSDVLPLLQTVANNLINVFGETGASALTLLVAQRNSPIDHLIVSSIIVRQVPGIQRRRNIGVGI